MNLALPLNFLTEFGCGFVLLASLSPILNFLGMLLMFAFCYKILHFLWRFKATLRFLCDFRGMPRIRFSFQNILLELSNQNIPSLENGSAPNTNSSSNKKNSNVTFGDKVKESLDDGSDGKDDSDLETRDEDTVFDVKKLRKLIKIQRRKANAACAELEQERTAASSSAEEAMAMILRLQGEKSSAEIEANQFRRMAEQKLEYDDEVIESLEWTITRHESHSNVLEEQLKVYKEELKQFLGDDEVSRIEAEVSRGRSFENEAFDSVASSDRGGGYGDDSPVNQIEADLRRGRSFEIEAVDSVASFDRGGGNDDDSPVNQIEADLRRGRSFEIEAVDSVANTDRGGGNGDDSPASG